MSDNEIKSLETYDGQKVTEAVKVFYDNVSKFDGVAIKINTAAHKFKDIWDGMAYDMFIEKFEVVYGQVTDISDALYTIYEMLQTAQDTFYQADDSLNQQMLEQQHKGGGGSGSSSGGGNFEYKDMKPLEIGQHNTPEAYVPNVALPPMYPLPVWSSTMGESYNPVFFYLGMAALAIANHNVPSPYIISLLYNNMNVKPVIQHNVGDATNIVLNKDQKELKGQVEHNVDAPYQPEFSYADMTPKEVVPHNTPDPYIPAFAYEEKAPLEKAEGTTIGEAYFPSFQYMTPSQKDRTMTSLSLAVTSTMTRCVASGMSIDEAKLALGEAVINVLSPSEDLTPEARAELAAQLGDSVFTAVCGDPSTLGEAVSGIAAREGIQWSKDALNGAVTQIMAGAPMPGCTAPTVADSVQQTDISSLQPQVSVLWNASDRTLTISANSMLGGSGTEGMDPAGLSAGMQRLSAFSIKMSAVRELAGSLENVPVDTSALSDLQVPVITINPSIGETRLSADQGEFVWTVNIDSASLMDNAIIQFTENPGAVSGADAELLQKEAVGSVRATAIQIPQITISIA